MPTPIDKLHRHWRYQQDLIWTLTKTFILGCGKSGTTWLVNLLNGHPQIAIRGEGCFTYQLVPAMQQAFGLYNNHQDKYKKDAAARLQPLDQLMLCRTAIDALLAHYLAASGRDATKLTVIGDKTPQHAASIEVLAQVYPEGRFIHIVRDPRDVAVSGWFHQGQASGKTFEQFVAHFITTVWPLHVGKVRQAAATLGDQLFEIRYDDVHTDAPESVQRMLGFLGVDASPAAVTRCIDAGRFERLTGGRPRGDEDRANFYRKGVVGDWVNHLDPALAERYCQPIAELMRAYGFDPHPAASSAAA